jgi:hypothetical protein
MDRHNRDWRDDYGGSIGFRADMFPYEHRVWRHFNLYRDACAGSAGWRVSGDAFLEQCGHHGPAINHRGLGSYNGELYGDCRDGDNQSNRHCDCDGERNFEDGFGDGHTARRDNRFGIAMLTISGPVWRDFELHGDLIASCAGRRIGSDAFLK